MMYLLLGIIVFQLLIIIALLALQNRNTVKFYHYKADAEDKRSGQIDTIISKLHNWRKN